MILEINLLNRQPQYIQAVSNMIYQEFVVGTASRKSLKDVEVFFTNTKINAFPMTFIAEIDGQCVGTVSVFENDWSARPQYKPWLASLYVEPDYRSQKVGQHLITCLLAYLKQRGYAEIYLKTGNASDYYKKRGWQLIESVKDLQGETVDIFKYTL